MALQVLELHQAGGGAGCCAGSNCPSAPTGRTLVLHQTQEGSGEQARVEYRLDTENPDLLEVKILIQKQSVQRFDGYSDHFLLAILSFW